jgi:hypothetical protein
MELINKIISSSTYLEVGQFLTKYNFIRDLVINLSDNLILLEPIESDDATKFMNFIDEIESLFQGYLIDDNPDSAQKWVKSTIKKKINRNPTIIKN